MKSILLNILIFSTVSSISLAQIIESPTIKENALYVSLSPISQLLVYEHNFANGKRNAYLIKAGYGLNQEIFGGLNQIITTNLSLISGKTKKNHFEMSGGAAVIYSYQQYNAARTMHTYQSSLRDYIAVYPSMYMGYRFQKPQGKFIFRYGVGYPEFSAFSFGFAF